MIAWVLSSRPGFPQVNYVARFTMEKSAHLAGEPVFCNFIIKNTGTQAFAFSYRAPNRTLNRALSAEPRFRVTDPSDRPARDPAPKPCGGAKGSVVYGSASLPPGQTHSEHWLLNQWARFSKPGRYRVLAERRLPLLSPDRAAINFSKRPAAYATAIDEFAFEILPSTEEKLQPVFQPYIDALNNFKSDPVEAVLVLTTLPHSFFEKQLESMALAPAKEQRWDRKDALEGLARLDTRAGWDVILKVARDSDTESLRSYAILLLAEKADKAVAPELLEMARKDSGTLRGDVLRALGFFRDPRANRYLFEALHSRKTTDRMNAILGLKNLDGAQAIPALIAMLSDPEAQVRQVANFALESLTGQHCELSASASREEAHRAAEQWHAWWQERGGKVVIARLPTCHDW